MIIKTQTKDGYWHLYDDVINVDYKFTGTKPGETIVKYSVLRRRGFDFSGETNNPIYILNDEGKTIEKLN